MEMNHNTTDVDERETYRVPVPVEPPVDTLTVERGDVTVQYSDVVTYSEATVASPATVTFRERTVGE